MHVSDLAAQAHTPADGNDVGGREKATVCQGINHQDLHTIRGKSNAAGRKRSRAARTQRGMTHITQALGEVQEEAG